jgi:hypothetical protein
LTTDLNSSGYIPKYSHTVRVASPSVSPVDCVTNAPDLPTERAANAKVAFSRVLSKIEIGVLRPRKMLTDKYYLLR